MRRVDVHTNHHADANRHADARPNTDANQHADARPNTDANQHANADAIPDAIVRRRQGGPLVAL